MPVNQFKSDPNDAFGDNDGDGLLDNEEVLGAKSDPNMYDTDGDRLSDGDEVNLFGTNVRARSSSATFRHVLWVFSHIYDSRTRLTLTAMGYQILTSSFSSVATP